MKRGVSGIDSNAKSHPVRKLLRYARIYGANRALTKAIARSRIPLPSLLSFLPRESKVGMIGCGQFAFSTLAYFLNGSHRIAGCYDIDSSASSSFAKRYRSQQFQSAEELLGNSYDVIYVASNHASHTDYAIQAMKAGVKNVYIEKPISVSMEQLIELDAHRVHWNARLFSGYNRPHSQAIREIRKSLEQTDLVGPMTLSCLIGGHVIPPDHWYRDPQEGTRVCGNIGHWIDLAYHAFSWRESLPETVNINISYSNTDESDDNICITFTTEFKDLIVVTLTSRAEPFEGIYEIINFQQGEVIANIDDFRRMRIMRRQSCIKKSFFPKDVGHKRTVGQPFESNCRPWSETVGSSIIMLEIMKMVKERAAVCEINLHERISRFKELRDQRIESLKNKEPN